MLKTHVVCINNQCKSGKCGKGDFLCYKTAEIVLRDSIFQIKMVAFSDLAKMVCPLPDTLKLP